MNHLLREVLYMTATVAAVVAGIWFGQWLMDQMKGKNAEDRMAKLVVWSAGLITVALAVSLVVILVRMNSA